MKKISIFFLTLLYSSQMIGNNIDWSFPPETLSSSNLNASEPQVAMDSSGNMVAVWVENGFVKSKYKLSTQDWGPVSTLSEASSSYPQVVSDLSGNATAVWLEGGFVKAASKTFKKVWGAPVALSNSNASYPSLSIDPAGDVIAVWARNGNVETATKLSGDHWQNVSVINSSGASYPHIALGGSCPNAKAVVVWNGVYNGSRVVFGSTKTLSGSWSAGEVLSDTSHHAGFAHAALDANCNAIAVWYLYDEFDSIFSNVTVQSAEMVNGGSWSDPVSLSSPGLRNPGNLAVRVAFDGSGNAVAIWNTSFDDATFTIQSAIKPVLGNWGSPTNLLSNNLYAYEQRFTVSALGDAIAVFMFYNGAAQIIQSSELDLTGFMQSSWSVPLNLSQGQNNAYPFLATSLMGNEINTAAIWITYNGMVNQVVATTGTKTLIGPPTSLKVTQSANNFGVFVEYYNTLSWKASTDASVVGYLIYRNGEFLGEVDANTLHYIDDNRSPSASVTYGVAAVDNQQSHSNVVSVTYN